MIGTFGPTGPSGRRHTVHSEAIGVSNEQVLAEVVRVWVERELPGDQGAATRAAAIALNCYRDSATVSEACRQASDFVVSWTRHPAHYMVEQDAVVRLAS